MKGISAKTQNPSEIADRIERAINTLPEKKPKNRPGRVD